MLNRCWVTVFIAGVIMLGCDSPQKLTKVSHSVCGQITLDGEPLMNAKIVFVPQKLMDRSREVIPMAYGMTDDKGKFKLPWSDGTARIKEGDYRVIISKQIKETDGQQFRLSDLVDEFENLVPDEFAMFRNKVLRDELLPERYNENTILTFKVDPERSKTADFDLTF